MTTCLPETPAAGAPLPQGEIKPALKSPVNRFAYDYWATKRGGRAMPARRDIDPAEIARILPHVFLLDVREDPLDFRYRLIGTKMDEYMLGRYTGLWMSQIPHQKAPSRIWANCRQVALQGRPLAGDTPYVGKGKEFLTTEDLIMPLSDDGRRVQMLFVTVGFV
ncbi:MAG: PAS domain-containing protein [Kiloniellaceae bacterium]